MSEEESQANRLLILSCSQRKRPNQEPLPAIERYDGPAFRVLRRYLREKSAKAPDVLILSAEYGLISQDSPITAYDRKMTPARARELRLMVLAALDRMTAFRSMSETLIFAGRQYLPALNIDDVSSLQNTTVKVCAGAMGRKLAELHDWLYGDPLRLSYNSNMSAEGNGARIRGVQVVLTPEQVFEAATDALSEGWGNPERYESWYVPVNGRCVAPKWLVSRISGLPVGTFTTDDARRLLARLGVEVRRT